jgi:fatty acid desaturase
MRKIGDRDEIIVDRVIPCRRMKPRTEALWVLICFALIILGCLAKLGAFSWGWFGAAFWILIGAAVLATVFGGTEGDKGESGS